MRGPKRASKIRKLFNLEKADDVRKYVNTYRRKYTDKARNAQTTENDISLVVARSDIPGSCPCGQIISRVHRAPLGLPSGSGAGCRVG